MTQDPHTTEQAPGKPLYASVSASTPEVGTRAGSDPLNGPQAGAEGFEGQPLAAGDCEHHYETRILGGHPITVRLCTLCRTPDWTDLYEQADTLYRWGREEGLAGKPPRERLSAYDMPQPDDDQPTPAPADLRQRLAEALMRWAEGNNSPKYASFRRPATVTANAYGRADAVLAELKHELHALTRVREACDQLRAASVLADGQPHTDREHGVTQAVDRILTALQPPAPAHDAGPSIAECAAADRNWDIEKAGEQ